MSARISGLGAALAAAGLAHFAKPEAFRSITATAFPNHTRRYTSTAVSKPFSRWVSPCPRPASSRWPDSSATRAGSVSTRCAPAAEHTASAPTGNRRRRRDRTGVDDRRRGVRGGFAPAAAAAGSGLLAGLAVAAVVACCNALLGATGGALPESGGAYLYGRERLGPFWGYLAGWCFVVGKVASCAAMAHRGAVPVAGRCARSRGGRGVALTAVNYRGIQKSAWATRVIVALTLAVLAAAVTVVATSGRSGN